jgi:two-component system cell cycle sensor histidine kinase/response regulator CckA
MASAASFAGGAPRRIDGAAILFVLAALASAALLLWAVESPLFAGAFLAGMIGVGGMLMLLRPKAAPAHEAAIAEAPDVRLLRDALDASVSGAAAITDAGGRLICASRSWTEWFGAESLPKALARAAPTARRDGSAAIPPINVGGRAYEGEVRLAGSGEGQLLWRLARAEQDDFVRQASRMIGGEAGRRMGEAGLMVAVADEAGTIRAANGAFAMRAARPGDDGAIVGSDFVEHLAASPSGQFHFAAEGQAATPLRIVQVPAGEGAADLSFFLLLDDIPGPRGDDENGHVHALLDSLPLGLALADTDGHFLFLNKVFRKSVGLGASERPSWPGDLVVEDDKAAVSDAVHRFGRGRAMSGDLAVRLKSNPEEPVALTVAGARGLGNAAVLLSLKDNSEEARLKREIAQATKMQAVGQLAGGVAHDFNNILTAILGTCDLMMMRHTPGDSDYDDIQQIRSNSNRAANLTRQLLAFSR